MSFANIPAELQALKQWVVWRLEIRPTVDKPTKVPYMLTGELASVTKAATWSTFEQVCTAPLTCVIPVPSDTPLSQTGFSGIGFVFTENDPYGFIDLDDTHGDTEAFARQVKIFNEFNSYAELSPSGNGLHIIIKGDIPTGRRRSFVEIYCKERYATMTGNVRSASTIQDRNDLFNVLYKEMSRDAKTINYDVDQAEKESDEAVMFAAGNAANGEKFKRLFLGDFETMYPSQSEADFALIDIIGYYTQNRAQIARIFRMSELGQRDKAKRDDYIAYMVNKSFDRALPPIDIEGFKIALERYREDKAAGKELASNNPAAATSARHSNAAGEPLSHSSADPVNSFPQGMLGQMAQFFLDAAPRQAPEIALAGAVGLMSGICGRGYNVFGTGLNQYILLLAGTGRGKDLITSGVNKLMVEVRQSCPVADEFKGPGEIVSSAGLIRWLDKRPTPFSILGEFGIKLKEMANPHSNPHLQSLERVLLQLYSKSGRSQVFDPSAYSDDKKNTGAILSPSFTMLGETVPERFYSALDEQMIDTGLMPRFLTFEYTGDRTYFNETSQFVQPPFELIAQVSDLCSTSMTNAHGNNPIDVMLDNEATEFFRDFDRWTTDNINQASNRTHEELWNRAHLKAAKLAAVYAVGLNKYQPIITMREATWARDIVVKQTERLIAKFETGQVGYSNNPEGKQIAEMIRSIQQYIDSPWNRFEKLGAREDYHSVGVFTESMLSRKNISVACFKHDKMGATNAIKRALKTLLDADDIREVPKSQMTASFGGRGPRAFVVSNPARFVETKD